MRWLYDNKVEASTIYPLTENPDFLFDTALKDTRLSRIGKTLSKEDQTFIFDLGSAYAVNYITILGSNITATAVIKIEGNSSDAWVTPAFSQSFTTGQLITYFDTETYQYWRLSIDDPDNAEDELTIGNIFIGSYLQLPYMGKTQKLPTASSSSSSESVSGQSYMDIGLLYKYGTIVFPVVSDTEKTSIDTAFTFLNKFKPFIMLIWENDLIFQPAIYSKLTTDMDFARVDGITGRTWSLSFAFKQTF